MYSTTSVTATQCTVASKGIHIDHMGLVHIFSRHLIDYRSHKQKAQLQAAKEATVEKVKLGDSVQTYIRLKNDKKRLKRNQF